MSGTIVVIVIALVVLISFVSRERFEDGYDCSQPWATCPNGRPFCYWGDKQWNTGKCCLRPWSSAEGCQDPVTSAPTPPTSVPTSAPISVPPSVPSLPSLNSLKTTVQNMLPWKKATATWYTSYPACCKPGFKGDRSECDDYSACKYQGMFAGLPSKMPESWVKSNDIVAVFQTPNSQNRKEWDSKWKNKRLRIRNPATGKVLEVTAVDTCDDKDCGGCCTRNANRNGGTLIDLEANTALRFYDGKVQDLQTIEYQVI